MTVEMDWREGDQAGDVAWDPSVTPVAVPAGPNPAGVIVVAGGAAPRRASGWTRFLLAMLAGALIGAVVLGVLLFQRVDAGNERIRQDVELTVGLLLDAQQSGDVRGYADLLDAGSQIWRTETIMALDPDTAPLTAAVQAVEMQGDLAVATIVEQGTANSPALTRTAFFRLSDGQWLLTPPQADTFGELRERATSHFLISYRQADEPAMDAVVDLAEGAYLILCSELRCAPARAPMRLALSYDGQDLLALRSPSLSGIGQSSRPGPAFEGALAGAIARQMAAEKGATTPVLADAVADWSAAGLAGVWSPEMKRLQGAQHQPGAARLEPAWQTIALRGAFAPSEQAVVASVLIYAQQTYGSDAVARILEAGQRPFGEVVQRAFAVPQDSFEVGWLRWLNQTQEQPILAPTAFEPQSAPGQPMPSPAPLH